MRISSLDLGWVIWLCRLIDGLVSILALAGTNLIIMMVMLFALLPQIRHHMQA
jgi:hypothetical protein